MATYKVSFVTQKYQTVFFVYKYIYKILNGFHWIWIEWKMTVKMKQNLDPP